MEKTFGSPTRFGLGNTRWSGDSLGRRVGPTKPVPGSTMNPEREGRVRVCPDCSTVNGVGSVGYANGRPTELAITKMFQIQRFGIFDGCLHRDRQTHALRLTDHIKWTDNLLIGFPLTSHNTWTALAGDALNMPIAVTSNSALLRLVTSFPDSLPSARESFPLSLLSKRFHTPE